ncbi:MAG: DHH family phosphoesterase [Clostridiales bacterium]|nr:DHH family phosphoesterase [Clostridiales bacterium]
MKKGYTQTVRTITAAAVIISAAFIVLSAYLVSLKQPIGWAGMAAGAVALAVMLVISSMRKHASEEFIKHVSKEGLVNGSGVMENLPVPAAMMQSDGALRWCNKLFLELTGAEDIVDKSFEKLVPQLKWNYILKNASAIDTEVTVGDRIYSVCGTMVKNSSAKEDPYSIFIYFTDKTEEVQLQEAYLNERTDIAVISIDNYDEMIGRVNDNEEQRITSKIRKYISEWAAEGDAIVKATDRDRYLVLFEHGYLDNYIEKKFDILDKVRSVGEEIKIPVSVSIGIGALGKLSQNETGARNALEMALGRGGDQVCIKDDTQYRFFGGKSREYEKSTRVKTRAVAVALKDFIRQSDKVIFMGHAGADYDCFGAAMGLQRAVRQSGREPFIVYDGNSPAIDRLYNEVKTVSEYKGMFVSAEDALEKLTEDTLVVVLDTHRPSMVAAPELLKNAAKVVLIDHHRRSTDFINPCSLIYHEPYASSVCEMATELIEYMDMGSNMTKLEAQSLYTGIIMDTKNFTVKTGVRTFDAASYLKRLGINTMEIKKLFNMNKTEYDRKVDIVKTASVIAPGMAVAKTYETYPNIRVSASQAADEMLNIGDIETSFVVYPVDTYIGVCARSLGTVNVQLIMEKLGGGGHMTIAGAQFKNETVDGVIRKIREAVEDYIAAGE